MVILVRYKVEIDRASGEQIITNAYYFLANPTTYLNVEIITGIKKVTNPNELKEPIIKIAELIGAGVLIRIAASGRTPTNKIKKYYILALRSRAGVVQNNLLGKTIQGVTITSVNTRRKASFY